MLMQPCSVFALLVCARTGRCCHGDITWGLPPLWVLCVYSVASEAVFDHQGERREASGSCFCPVHHRSRQRSPLIPVIGIYGVKIMIIFFLCNSSIKANEWLI